MYYFKVIHHPTGKSATAGLFIHALSLALGIEPATKFMVDLHNLNFFQSDYRTATLIPPQGMPGKQTTVSAAATYEVAGIYTNPKRTNLLVTIYRAKHPDTLNFLPEHDSNPVATVAKPSRRKGKVTRSQAKPMAKK